MLKKAALIAALCLTALISRAQNTTITANNIQLFGGGKVTGSFCVSPTDGSGNPINVTTSTGQMFTPQTPLCFPIVAGVLSASAIVPDTSLTSPANVCYALTVKNTFGQTIGSYPCIQPFGATWSFDTFIPTSIPIIPSFQQPVFKTNGVPNAVQTVLNLAGAGVSYANGTVTIAGGGTGSANLPLYPAQCGGASPPSWCNEDPARTGPQAGTIGTTPDSWYRAACAGLPSNGGWISLHGLAGNWAATSRGCSSPTKQVVTEADPTTAIAVTETDGDAPIVLDSYSMFIGPGKGQCIFGKGFKLASTANVNAIIENAHTDGTQEAMVVEGACLAGNASATVGQALIFSQRIYANTTIEGNTAVECNKACAKILNGSSIEVYNNWFNASGGASFGGSALIVQGSGLGTGCNVGPVNVHGGQIEHGYGGVPDVLVEGDGAGAQACGIHLYDFGTERDNNSGSTIGIKIVDCLNCSVDHVFPSGTSGGTDFINVSQTASGRTSNVPITNIYASGAWTNVINDTTPSPAVAQPMSATSYPQITEYVVAPGYEASAGVTSSSVTTAIAGQSIAPASVNSVVYAAGVTGAGVGIAQAAWSSSTNYALCSAVSHSSSNYIAVAANTNVTPGTNTADWWPVPNANTPTAGDCAFYIAASEVNGSAGAELVLPPGNTNLCIGFYEPTVTVPGNPVVAIHGAGKHISTVTQTCSISTAVVTQPQSTVAYALANLDWSDFAINANWMAPAAANVYGAQQYRIQNVLFENPTDGSDHYVEFGEASGANHTYGWTYENYFDNNDTLNGHAGGSGAALTASGSSPTITVTSGGTGYASAYTVLILTGSGANADSPCTSRGTDTINVSSGVITSITTTATGCTSPLYAHVFGNNQIKYCFKFNDASDSKSITGNTPEECNTGIYLSNITSQMTLVKNHPVATYIGIEDLGNNEEIANEMDTVYRYGYDFEGASNIENVYATKFVYALNIPGVSDYHFGTATGSPSSAPYQINIFGDACGQAAPTAGGYYHFLASTGGGNSYLPAFVHAHESTSCDQLSSNSSTFNYTGSQFRTNALHIGASGAGGSPYMQFWDQSTAGDYTDLSMNNGSFQFSNGFGYYIFNSPSSSKSLNLQETGSPYAAAQQWFDGTSAGSTGSWLKSPLSANVELGDTSGTYAFNVKNSAGTTVASFNSSGIGTAATPTAGTNNTDIATTAFVLANALQALTASTAPTTTSSSCGTLGTPSGNALTGTITSSGATTCTIKLNFSYTAPHGWNCQFYDVTTSGYYYSFGGVGATSTTSCTSVAGTITSGDTLSYFASPR